MFGSKFIMLVGFIICHFPYYNTPFISNTKICIYKNGPYIKEIYNLSTLLIYLTTTFRIIFAFSNHRQHLTLWHPETKSKKRTKPFSQSYQTEYAKIPQRNALAKKYSNKTKTRLFPSNFL